MNKQKWAYGIMEKIPGVCGGKCLVRIPLHKETRVPCLGRVTVLAIESVGHLQCSERILYTQEWSCHYVRFTRFPSKELAEVAFSSSFTIRRALIGGNMAKHYLYGIASGIRGVCDGPCLVRVNVVDKQKQLGYVRALAHAATVELSVTEEFFKREPWTCYCSTITYFKSKKAAQEAFLVYLL